MAQRVLVVDDVAEMRILVRRALRTAGYEVDVAATLAEALGMDPGGYDAIVVDASLGAERGTDLIDALRSQDEAIADRCLVITGGAVDLLPGHVASLAKPFQLDELLDAVRALRRADGSLDPDLRLPAAGGEPAAGPPFGEFLGIIRRLRARERQDLADYLHDGPIQELTAASLELQMMRRSASGGPQLDSLPLGSLQRQVDEASAALRGLVDGAWPFLAARIAVDADAVELGAAEAAVIADVVELTLLATEAAGPTARAHVTVRTDESRIEIDLVLRPGRADEILGDQAGVRPVLDLLAAALGASLRTEFTRQQWRVRLAAPQPAP